MELTRDSGGGGGRQDEQGEEKRLQRHLPSHSARVSFFSRPDASSMTTTHIFSIYLITEIGKKCILLYMCFHKG